MWKHLVTRCQFFRTRTSNFLSRGSGKSHGSLTPSHANEAMEFRPEENVDAHSCTCIVETFDKLLLFRVSLQDWTVLFESFPSNFDNLPIPNRPIFDDFSNHFRWNYELTFDELQVGLRRTMLKFPWYVNRGLWDNLSLPRTIPDKHVELSSVCHLHQKFGQKMLLLVLLESNHKARLSVQIVATRISIPLIL